MFRNRQSTLALAVRLVENFVLFIAHFTIRKHRASAPSVSAHQMFVIERVWSALDILDCILAHYRPGQACDHPHLQRPTRRCEKARVLVFCCNSPACSSRVQWAKPPSTLRKPKQRAPVFRRASRKPLQTGQGNPRVNLRSAATLILPSSRGSMARLPWRAMKT